MGCGSSSRAQVQQDPDAVVPNAPSSGDEKNANLPECRLRIFHINDVYRLDNLPVLRSCIDARSEGVNVLTTLAGDFVAPSLLSSIDHGRGMVTALNAIPVQAVCFGNHECDIPFRSLVSRIKEFNGVWLNSNMPSMLEESELDGQLAEHQLLKLDGGRSVILTGFCVGGGRFSWLYRKNAFNGHADRITPVLDAVDEVVSKAYTAYPEADCVIPLTHQDLPEDIEMTTRGHDFPVILGGHDHDVVCEKHNGTHIVKAGEDAQNVAVIDLVWEQGAPKNSPPKVTVELIPLEPGPSVESVAYEADPTMQESIELLQKPAIELQLATLAAIHSPLDDPLSSVGVRFHECSMATLLASSLREVGGADGALMNAGSIRGEKVYPDGKIRFADLAAEVPFPSTLIVARIPGAVLTKAVAQSRAPWHGAETPRAGAPAGSTSHALHFDDGIKSDPISEELIEVAGKPFEPDSMYDIVIDSFLMHNDAVLKEYSTAHPEHVPSEETGRPALPMLVQYFSDKVWCSLCDIDGDGEVQIEEVDEFFDLADTDGNGKLDVDELMVAMSLKLGDLDVTKVLAQQCVSLADEDGDGKVSKEELQKFMKAEAAARTNRTI